jgi:predicted GNAT family acetyltransferase
MRRCLYLVVLAFGVIGVAGAAEAVEMEQSGGYDQNYENVEDVCSPEKVSQEFWKTKEFQEEVAKYEECKKKIKANAFLNGKVGKLTKVYELTDSIREADQQKVFQEVLDYMNENGYDKYDFCSLIYNQYNMNDDASFDNATSIVSKWCTFLDEKKKSESM